LQSDDLIIASDQLSGAFEAFIMAPATAGVGSKAAKLRNNANHGPPKETERGRRRTQQHGAREAERPKRRGSFSARAPLFSIIDLFRHFQSRLNHPFNDNPDET